MTRVGWIFLGLVVLIAAAFGAMTNFGGSVRSSRGVDQKSPLSGSAMPLAPGLPVLNVPVEGVARTAISDTWGQARSEGRVHHGTDIPAPQGTPVLAAADGVIEKLFQSRLGGTTLYQRSADRRWTFYYAHLSGYAPGVHEGQVVRAGDPIATVGDTGDAGAGNYHLHFGLTRTATDQRWYQGEDVNAFPALAGTATRR